MRKRSSASASRQSAAVPGSQRQRSLKNKKKLGSPSRHKSVVGEQCAAYVSAVVCGVAGSVVYLNTLHHGFVFDDRKAILDNVDVRSATSASGLDFGRLFQNDFWGKPVASSASHKSYRPLTVFTFQLDHVLQGNLETAAQFHLTNIILFGVCCALVVLFVDALGFRSTRTLQRRGDNGSEHSGAPNREDGVGSGNSDDAYFRLWVLLLTGFLFAAHPIHTEAVASLVGRAEILSGIFFCAAGIVFQRIATASTSPGNFGLWLAWLLLSVTSTLCKEQGIAIFPLCIAWDLIVRTDVVRCLTAGNPSRDLSAPPASDKAAVSAAAVEVATDQTQPAASTHSCVPLFSRVIAVVVTAAATLVVRLQIAGNEPPDFRTQHGGLQVNVLNDIDNVVSRQLTMAKIWSINFGLLLAPHNLSASWINYVRPVELDQGDVLFTLQENIGAIATALALGVWLVVAIFAKHRSSSQLLLLAGALTVVTYLPASNLFVHVGFTIAERVLFLPSLGICLLLATISAVGLRWFLRKEQYFANVLWVLPWMVLLFWWVTQTADRNNDWKDGTSLWLANIATQPQNPESFYALGEESMAQHRVLRATPGIDPQLVQQCLQSAIEYYQQAVAIQPTWAMAQNSLGTALEKLYGFQAGLQAFDRAIALNPRYQAAYYNKGSALTKLGRFGEAIVALETAANLPLGYDRVDYVPMIFMHLALAHKGDGRFLEAEANFKKAIELNPRNDKVHSNYANMLGAEGRMDEAIAAFDKALSIAPRNPTTTKNYGTLLYRAHRKEEVQMLPTLTPYDALDVMSPLCGLFRQPFSGARSFIRRWMLFREPHSLSPATQHTLLTLARL
eukprot:INCI4675.1.p1 GENE.INCI4675.1~~INCI4675.1.p1  ORF type:complete len:844 (+),score=121.07 INCI4675.1:171-2702(+)